MVADEGCESEKRPQNGGINQGCPLSPFLFGMIMTVLMTDASSMLSRSAEKKLESRKDRSCRDGRFVRPELDLALILLVVSLCRGRACMEAATRAVLTT